MLVLHSCKQYANRIPLNRCRKAQEELAESEGRRATEALEREAATARKLQSVELQLRAERAGREAAGTQLLKAEDGQGEREAAWEAQRQVCVYYDVCIII